MHYKMKINPMILVLTMVFTIVIVVTESEEINEVLFEGCNPNEWAFINTTIKWKNNTNHIATRATYNEPGRPIYEVHIMINDCKNHTFCSGKPRTQILNVDCSSNNLSEDNMNVCKTIQEAGNLKQEREWLITRYGQLFGNELYILLSCLNFLDLEKIKDNDNSKIEISYGSLE